LTFSNGTDDELTKLLLLGSATDAEFTKFMLTGVGFKLDFFRGFMGATIVLLFELMLAVDLDLPVFSKLIMF
jgi:hypothetical protein